MDINKKVKEMFEYRNPDKHIYKSGSGLNEDVVKAISKYKNEPEWMLDFRLKSLEVYKKLSVPKWGADLSELDPEKITYFAVPDAKHNSKSWDEVPEDIKNTFKRLGIPEAEQKYLAGVGSQYDSLVVYHKLKQELEKKGVIFEDMDVALQRYPEVIKEYFMTKCIPITLHKYIALHGAVWSGGCLTENARIFTLNPGLKKISEIEEGEQVFALDENNNINPSKVIAKIYTGKKEVYEILVGGRTLEATNNHRFLTLEKSEVKLNNKGNRWIRKWKSLGELKIGDVIAITKKLPDFGKSKSLPDLDKYNSKNYRYQEKLLSVPKFTNEDLLWFLGLWLGDENTYSPNKHMFFINLAIVKKSPLRRILINEIKSLFDRNVKTENETSITTHSKALGLWLKKIGFFGNAKTKRIPEWIFGLPLNERLALLGGLLDSDGYTEKKGSLIRFELANEGLIEDIKLLGISCGLYSNGKIISRERKDSYSKKLNRYIKGGRTFLCRFSGNIKAIKCKHPELIKELNSAKKFTFDKYNTSHGKNFSYETNEFIGFAPIKNKEYIGLKDVYDIQVENNHNFVTNGIIAHNSFIHVPEGVKLGQPLQAYFRMNTESFGQFEHTLIILEKNAEASYIEGCSSPKYYNSSLHAGCVELFVKEGARLRYSSAENWSNNTYNLNTKRAIVEKNGVIEWITANMGSKCSMVYPCSILKGENSRADHLSIGYAGKNQEQDIGAKIYHLAPNTTSIIKSKSISKNGGITRYRGLLMVSKGAENSKSKVQCDALMLDNISKSETIPMIEIKQDKASIAHEATVGKISQEQIFYLMSRGLTEEQATQMIVNGFIEPIVRELPIEYAVELNRLIELEIEGSLG